MDMVLLILVMASLRNLLRKNDSSVTLIRYPRHFNINCFFFILRVSLKPDGLIKDKILFTVYSQIGTRQFDIIICSTADTSYQLCLTPPHVVSYIQFLSFALITICVYVSVSYPVSLLVFHRYYIARTGLIE